MEQLEVSVEQVERIAKQTIKLNLKLDLERLSKFKPGQFIHIKVTHGTEYMLRRPISIANIDLDRQVLTVIFKIFGEGTRIMAQLQVGQLLDILIPCGNGYPIEDLKIKHALLIGGGVGVPPLYYLARKLVEKGIKVTTIIGFQTKDDIFYQAEFKALGSCFVTTDDGSYGHRGFVTDVIEQETIDFDYYFSCGPTAMLKTVQNKLDHFPGYISLEERMGCGIGACYACIVPSTDGKEYKKICVDGPVFGASEVMI
ncbi:dihydroorotate dehydrogenase electron transfer subunit [Amphibacillus sp. Q70]|uniref:dihydroorotate dehydrogenase electron transfer subunit n=1 Tax=Amphibacillus sp. Q70 TaxID=3453416 RepID=UPI003F87DDA1